MKKIVCAFLSLLLILPSLAACGGEKGNLPDDGKTRIVCTIFPVYDWTRQILGDQAPDAQSNRTQEAELKLLLDKGVDMHSYQPTVADMAAISNCDLFIYVGGESDEWAEDALAASRNPNMTVINLIDVLGETVRREEVVEGMQEEAEHGEYEEAEYDEHVWLSLKNARICCDAIAGALSELLPAEAAAFADNLAAYKARLADLDAQYEEAVHAASVKTLLFGDRFPFRYLTDDYGLSYYAAFPGCSAETEASFETVIFLAGKVDELGLPAVLTIESGDGKIARTIVENTAAKSALVLRMDSLQSTTAWDAADGATYLGAMEGNLDVLRQALA